MSENFLLKPAFMLVYYEPPFGYENTDVAILPELSLNEYDCWVDNQRSLAIKKYMIRNHIPRNQKSLIVWCFLCISHLTNEIIRTNTFKPPPTKL